VRWNLSNIEQLSEASKDALLRFGKLDVEVLLDECYDLLGALVRIQKLCTIPGGINIDRTQAVLAIIHSALEGRL
jgi:hypothetical protein